MAEQGEETLGEDGWMVLTESWSQHIPEVVLACPDPPALASFAPTPCPAPPSPATHLWAPGFGLPAGSAVHARSHPGGRRRCRRDRWP